MKGERIIEQPNKKRFVNITEYSRMSGLGYQAINHAMDTGQLRFIQYESGRRMVDTWEGNPLDTNTVLAEIEKLKKAVGALCKQFNTPVA